MSGSRGRKKSKIFDFFKMSPKCLKSVSGCRKRDLVKFCCVFVLWIRFCSFLVCGWALWVAQNGAARVGEWVSSSKKIENFRFLQNVFKVHGGAENMIW